MNGLMASKAQDDPLQSVLLPVRELLTGWTLGQYLSTRPPSTVVTVIDTMTLAQANRAQCLGFLDLTDILKAVLGWMGVLQVNQAYRLEKLHSAGERLEKELVRNVVHGNDGQLIYKANEWSTLLEVIALGLLRPVGDREVCHRVAVFDYEDSSMDEDEDDVDGTVVMDNIRILSIISQSDIVRFLHQHRDLLGPVAGSSVQSLGLASKTVVCVSSDMPLINAFAAMYASHVSSAGVISSKGHGALIGNLSVSDLRGILPHNFEALNLSVMQFLSHRDGDLSKSSWARLHQQHSTNAWGVKSGDIEGTIHVATCQPSSSFLDVLHTLVTQRLHRVYVIDIHQRPVSIITLTDVLRILVQDPVP